ncbi:Nitrate reductase [Phytophthora cinnamomi]|uniref:Nitrate reductase n=1 Tax=Phytophthora cinnamomi TaxID=4785 RepID=UPI003559A806|nr:Nitrate reductase [Phytophthora cinnamomi]
MGACYPMCMGAGEDPQLLPGVQAKRPVGADASSYEAALASKMQTFDLEELGLAAAPQLSHSHSHSQPPKSIVVDYEDSDGEHPEPRGQAAAACAPSACGPLTGGVAAVDSSNGRLARRRSRGASMDGALRGKSVIFDQEAKATEPASPATTDSDAEEGAAEARCSKVHKLCMCELKLHRSLESCWLVSSGQVYDVTGLVTAHPGGVRSILRKAGGPDCARDMKFHTKNARKMMEKCFIGKLQPCGDDVDCSGDATCSIM